MITLTIILFTNATMLNSISSHCNIYIRLDRLKSLYVCSYFVYIAYTLCMLIYSYIDT